MARYMLIMRSTPEAEAAMEELNIDFSEIIESMGRFNEELIKAGVMLAGEGLTGPEEGFVVDFNADPPVVTDGPTPRPRNCSTGSGSSTCRRRKRPSSGRRRSRWARASRSRCAGCPKPTEFPQDNPWIQKEIQWKADLAEKIAAQARADADRLVGR